MKKKYSYYAVSEFAEQESVLVSWPPDVESIRGENVEEVMICAQKK